VGHRFFKVDILAAFHRFDRHACVPVIGSRDNHRVNVLAFQQLVIIEVSSLALRRLFRKTQSLGVDVGHRDYLGRSVWLLAGLHHPFQKTLTAAADADQRDVDIAV